MSTTDHPLTETAAAEMWDTTAPYFDTTTTSGMARPEFVECVTTALRAAFDAGREHERTNPADDRPWEPLNGPLRVGDEARQELNGITITAVVGWVDADGDPWTAECGSIGLLSDGTWYIRRAPAPPAVEVDLPDEHPAHITDVEDVVGDVCAYMALDNTGDWCGVSKQGQLCDWRPHNLVAFTLPDGTRARRDGERENGEPRFIKVRGEEE